MGHANSAVHRGGKPGLRKPNVNWRPELDVQQAIIDWCRINGVDPEARGATTRALHALVRAGRDALHLGQPDAARARAARVAANILTAGGVDLAAAADRGVQDVPVGAALAEPPGVHPPVKLTPARLDVLRQIVLHGAKVEAPTRAGAPPVVWVDGERIHARTADWLENGGLLERDPDLGGGYRRLSSRGRQAVERAATERR